MSGSQFNYYNVGRLLTNLEKIAANTKKIAETLEKVADTPIFDKKLIKKFVKLLIS